MGENCITCDVVLGEFWGLILLLAAVLDNTPFGNQILLFTFLPAFYFRNDLRWRGLSVLRFYRHCLFGRPSGGVVFLFYVFTGILFSVGPPGAMLFCFAYLRAALGGRRPPVAPSFAARRKIEEKGVSRGCGPLNPRGNVLDHSDVLCAYVFAMVRVTRLSRLRRSAYPLASACCAAQKD